MKTGIHPKYEPAKITCACGRVTETRSTVGEIHVEICSHCHPFFTGRQKLVDTAGRVERFKAKYAASGSSESPAAVEEPAPEAVAETVEAPEAEAPVAEAAETGTVEAPVAEADADGEADETADAPADEAEDDETASS